MVEIHQLIYKAAKFATNHLIIEKKKKYVRDKILTQKDNSLNLSVD